jgi:hypothetical protein
MRFGSAISNASSCRFRRYLAVMLKYDRSSPNTGPQVGSTSGRLHMMSECLLLYKSGALVLRHNSARDIDNQRDSSVAALVLGRHVGCVRAGSPKSNRRQLTWLHAGMDKML